MNGNELDLANDSEILKIRSPRSRLCGPFLVITKNLDERWAIVAMSWDGKPCLGIRWFWGKSGTPISRNFPTWLVLPHEVSYAYIKSLSNEMLKASVLEFINKEIDENELCKRKYN